MTDAQLAGLTKALLTESVDAATEVPLARSVDGPVGWFTLAQVGVGSMGWFYRFNAVFQRNESTLLMRLANTYTCCSNTPCNLPEMTFNEYQVAVSYWCVQLWGCSWADLCGDLEPVQRARERGDTPEEFARWWGERYDLTPKEVW